MASKNKVNNQVAKDGVIKEQVFLEDYTSKAWTRKWGFMKDTEKLCLQIASERGISKDEYKKLLQKRTNSIKSYSSERNIAPSGPAPKTTSGEIGWRSSKQECLLEIFGPLYVSPRHTINPPDPDQTLNLPQSNIILG